MSATVYRIYLVLYQILTRVPVGTNLGLLHLLFALMSGRFLSARGAVFPALAALQLPAREVRRSVAALSYGRWKLADLLAGWQRVVAEEGQWVPVCHEGIRPVACDLTAFFRPHLQGLTGKHYLSSADKALPALTFALVARRLHRTPTPGRSHVCASLPGGTKRKRLAARGRQTSRDVA